MMPIEPTPVVSIPDHLQGWLVVFLREAIRENDTLIENGAPHATLARVALLTSLICT